jgi:uncharacterized SAM-binding protein YcdF (DUF218 family)
MIVSAETIMFFYLSKIVWGILAPTTLVIVLMIALILALIYCKGHHFNQIKRIALYVVAFMAVLLVLPIGDWMLHPWETRYPPIALPGKVNGIVVLGGAVDPVQTAYYNQIAINSHAERIAILPWLIHHYPHAMVIYSGGSGYVYDQDKKEAEVARRLLQTWNVPLKMVVFERNSRNTFENAVESKKLAKPKPFEKWLLVTSAVHMPRAKAIFDKQDWTMIPFPVDFHADPHPPVLCFCAGDNLGKIEELVHEMIGMVVYKLTGKA